LSDSLGESFFDALETDSGEIEVASTSASCVTTDLVSQPSYVPVAGGDLYTDLNTR
jgi:hypothetical protein